MRVLILTQFCKPEPVPKVGELAVELQRLGHEVTVVTGFPNYPSGDLYPGYRLGLINREMIDGVPVVRTFEYPYHGLSMVRRMLNYVSFMVTSVFGAMVTAPCDVVYVFLPPVNLGISAWLVGLVKRAPVVCDVQDIWPESAVASGLISSRWLIASMHRIERFVYARARRILCVTEAARQNIISKGVPAAKVSVASHWIGAEEFACTPANPELKKAYQFDNCFVVMFAGNIGLVQGLDVVVQAAELMRMTLDIKFVVVGDGVDLERLRRYAADRNLQNVVFIGRQPRDKMTEILAAADAFLVHLKRSAISDLSIPTKTLAYMSAGKPLIMAVPGEASSLIDRAGAGVTIQPDEPAALAEAVRQLVALGAEGRRRMGDSGRRYCMEHFLKSKVCKVYEQILAEAAQHG